MSIRDAAQATGLSPKALRRRIERGTLTSVMIGGRRRIPMEDLARRGLISAGRAPLAPFSLLADARVAGEAIDARLRSLEARVSALETAAGTASGADGAAADGASDDSEAQPDAVPESPADRARARLAAPARSDAELA